MTTRPLRTEIIVQESGEQSKQEDDENTAATSTTLAPHIAPALCVFCNDGKQVNLINLIPVN